MPQPHRKPTQLSEVVHSVLRVFHAQLQEKAQIIVRTELEPELPTISADPDMLHRALSNLVLNAIDALPQGGTIAIQTREDGDEREVAISDTRAGLTQEN